MAKRVSELRTANKAGNTSREYVLLSNVDSNTSTKLALNDIFPTLQSGKVTSAPAGSLQTNNVPLDIFVGGGVGSSTANTDKSVLIFKGLAVDDTQGALFLRSDKSTADGTKQNLVIGLDHRRINLSLGDNTTSAFLSESGGSNALNLETSSIGGTLPVTRGGTGFGAFTQGGLLYGNGTAGFGVMSAIAAGSLLVGQGTGSSPAELPISATNGTVLTVSGSNLVWQKPSISTASLSSTLLMNNNNINLGTGYLSGTGTSSGLSLSNSSDYVYIGSGTKYYNARLNVDGNLTLGNSSGTAEQTIKIQGCTAGASPALNILGSDNADSNTGGNINITAGGGDTNGNGGHLSLGGGIPAGTGAAGNVYLKTNNTVGLSVDENQDVNVTNNLTLSQGKTIELRGTETVTQATSITTDVTLNATAGVIVLHATAIAGHDSHYFTFNNTLINARSIILLSCEVDGAEASGAGLTAQLADRAAGSVKIRVSNTGNATTTTNHSIHFLIMNVYV